MRKSVETLSNFEHNFEVFEEKKKGMNQERLRGH